MACDWQLQASTLFSHSTLETLQTHETKFRRNRGEKWNDMEVMNAALYELGRGNVAFSN